MSASRVASQASGALADSATSVSVSSPANITNGNLVVIGGNKFSNSQDSYVAGSLTKTAGTSTIGTIALDNARDFNFGPAELAVAVYSVPVTGTGSSTFQLGGFQAGSFLMISIQEYTGVDVSGSRVVGTNSATGTSTAPNSGTVVSGVGGVFVGSLSTPGTPSSNTITEGSGYANVFKQSASNTHQIGAVSDKIVTVNTTDSANWTLGTSDSWVGNVVFYKESSSGVSAALTGDGSTGAFGTQVPNLAVSL
jgi:hypothetical protein